MLRRKSGSTWSGRVELQGQINDEDEREPDLCFKFVCANIFSAPNLPLRVVQPHKMKDDAFKHSPVTWTQGHAKEYTDEEERYEDRKIQSLGFIPRLHCSEFFPDSGTAIMVWISSS